MEEENKPISKKEMFDCISNKAKNISDIQAYMIFIADKKTDSTLMLGECSELFLLEFIAKGILNLAENKGGNIFKTAMDALALAIKINEFEQQKKEQEGV